MMRCRCLCTNRQRMPLTETQIATVLGNADPDGKDRVPVRMNWQADDMNTNWIRVMTPDAGKSGDVKSNRGFVFIPEVGDHVLVASATAIPPVPMSWAACSTNRQVVAAARATTARALPAAAAAR
ncbi:phage baseplate assembly protein V [Prevotella fusca]|uniref:phage baseplate assembly protein V n=1 Tax=Prevotella fusca TaxID=589436 RepID=UPI00190153C7|nr:phage baseplate assembly protein V [Prevotella fusca]